jgi:predicted enzyme related to lactoylglutathione lyase
LREPEGGRKIMADHGTFYWNELTTNDVAKARKFYEETLGWTFDSMPMPGGGHDYLVANANGKPVGGIFDTSGTDMASMPEFWMSYIAVDDVDKRVEKAKKAGATVIRPPFDVQGVGRIAILQQPGGGGIGWITPTPQPQQ